MADWFLILATCISFLLLLVASVYFLVLYQHPDDRNEAWFPKLTVLLGLVLAGATVLLLPLDVANNEGYAGCLGYDTTFCGGFNMVLFWEIFFWAIPAVVFLLIPFMTFFYEADDGMLMAGTSVGARPNSRICEAVKYEIAIIIVVGGLMLVGYLLLGVSEVPLQSYSGSIPAFDFQTTASGNNTFSTVSLSDMSTDDIAYADMVAGTKSSESLTMQVNIPTFLAGFMSFIGWLCFALFGGVGLAAVPLDLILAWVHRPTHMDPSEFADAQMVIRSRVNELVNIGEMLKLERDDRRVSGKRGGMFKRYSAENRQERGAFLEFRKAVLLLEEDVEEFQACSANYESYNPLWPWISLFSGLFSIILSAAWLVHIGLFMVPRQPIHPLLNSFFQWIDFFPLFGILALAILTLYLLLCAVKGCFKFGIRFLLFQVHPMKLNKTYMSSFMFNVGVILLCALPVVQFCVSAFSDYARYTTISQVMGVQVRNLKFFKIFWVKNIFVYAMLGVTVLTILYLFLKPRDRSGIDSKSLKERLQIGGRKRI